MIVLVSSISMMIFQISNEYTNDEQLSANFLNDFAAGEQKSLSGFRC